MNSSARQPWTWWTVYGHGTETSFPATVLVLVCCTMLVVSISKMNYFIWKLVVKARLLCSLVGIGKRVGWDAMG